MESGNNVQPKKKNTSMKK